MQLLRQVEYFFSVYSEISVEIPHASTGFPNAVTLSEEEFELDELYTVCIYLNKPVLAN